MSETDGRDVYAPPESTLHSAPVIEGYGSIEAALAGEIEISAGDTFSEAWALVKGTKRIFILGMLLMYLAFIPASLLVVGVVYAAGYADDSGVGLALQMGANMAFTLLMYPFLAGVIMVGIRQSVGAPIQFSQLFGYYSHMGSLVVAAVLISIGTTLGFLLLLLPGLFLSMVWSLTVPLIADKNLGAWEAMEISRKALTRQWLPVLLIFITIPIAMLASMFLLFIPLIWIGPWVIMVMAVLYRNLFGVSSVEA